MSPRRILVVTSGALFVRGGHLTIAEQVVGALRAGGDAAELLVTPQNRFGRQFSAYLSTWLTDVGQTADGHAVDAVISLRFPSYAVRHPRHVCWLNHRMREYYDLWEHFVRGLGRRGRLKERIRRALIHRLDHYLLTRNVGRLVAQSRTIQQRLQRFGGIASSVIHPPAPERPYRTDAYGDHVFAVSRLHPLKRLDLLVEAAGLLGADAPRMRIAGEGEGLETLRARIRELGLEGRVELLGRIDDAQLVAEYAACRSVYFAPRSEDYGFVTLEAFRSGKAVITCPDSGGPAELVRHEENGLVVEPTPEGVAAALSRLSQDSALAERLGRQARTDAAGHRWEDVVERLLEFGSEEPTA